MKQIRVGRSCYRLYLGLIEGNRSGYFFFSSDELWRGKGQFAFLGLPSGQLRGATRDPANVHCATYCTRSIYVK